MNHTICQYYFLLSRHLQRPQIHTLNRGAIFNRYVSGTIKVRDHKGQSLQCTALQTFLSWHFSTPLDVSLFPLSLIAPSDQGSLGSRGRFRSLIHEGRTVALWHVSLAFHSRMKTASKWSALRTIGSWMGWGQHFAIWLHWAHVVFWLFQQQVSEC
jgi:hypothetical protein